MTKNLYVIPLSIIIAGSLIGGGLAYGLSRGGGIGTNPGQAEGAGNQLSLSDVARKVGLNVDAFEVCLKSEKYAERIGKNAKDAQDAGAQGTPYSVVVDAKGNKASINGAQPYENVKSLIDQALKGSLVNEKLIKIIPVSKEDHMRGSMNAPVTIIEYSDFSCPFCKRFHPSLQQALREYDGKVRWIYRHFPLSAIHPNALKQANASECANEQGKFWEYADMLFES